MTASAPVRACIVYDCLYPHTRGGGERWYRSLAEAWTARGWQVTYLTRQQWPDGEDADVPHMRVVAVTGPGPLYDERGRRRVGPPVRFGAGVLIHLLRHRHSYDVVHVGSFPFFALLAARLALIRTSARLGIDWLEVWSRGYWRGYIGGVGGRVGWAVQALCIRLTPLAFTYAETTAARLRAGHVGGEVMRPGGLLPELPEPTGPVPAGEGVVLLVGRLIPEKRAELLPPVVHELRDRGIDVRGVVIGDGPSRPDVAAAVVAGGGTTTLAGFVDERELIEALRGAACLLVCSEREGWGIVVAEAAAVGTPVVVVDAPDSAAVDLVRPGVNGFVAASADVSVIADAIADVLAAGDALRRSTAAWFSEHADELSAVTTAAAIAAHYESGV